MNHILITGATGALGSELIPRFLRDPATRVSVLLRADSLEMLAGRREKLLVICGWIPSKRASVSTQSRATHRNPT